MYDAGMATPQSTDPKFSVPSIIAIVAAIGSFAVGAIGGFILAMVALAFGILGMILAFSSRTRGGLVSLLAIAGGILGVIAAVLKAVLWLF